MKQESGIFGDLKEARDADFKKKCGMSKNEFKFRYGLWGGVKTRLDEHGSYLYWPMREHGGREANGYINVDNWVGPGIYDHTKFNYPKPKSRKAYIAPKSDGFYCSECLGYGGHTKYCSQYMSDDQIKKDLVKIKKNNKDSSEFLDRVAKAQDNVMNQMKNRYNRKAKQSKNFDIIKNNKGYINNQRIFAY